MPYTLTVNFTLPSPNPGSFRVKYWPVSSPSTITTVLVSASPVTIQNLTEPEYAGTIESSCGSGQYSSAQSFTATAPNTTMYINCGYGNTESEACTDSSVNHRTLYSNCASGTFGPGCNVFTDPYGNTPLTGYTKLLMDNANWDITTSGTVTVISGVQC